MICVIHFIEGDDITMHNVSMVAYRDNSLVVYCIKPHIEPRSFELSGIEYMQTIVAL